MAEINDMDKVAKKQYEEKLKEYNKWLPVAHHCHFSNRFIGEWDCVHSTYAVGGWVGSDY